MILAFIDCETTHLSAEIGEAWEVAVILRDHDGAEAEYVWQFRPLNPAAADPESLKIGRFEERYAVPHQHEAAFTGYPDGPIPMTRKDAVKAVISVLSGATLVGSNPGFDDRFLRKLVGPGGAQWAYRPTCIATLAEGYLWAIDSEFMAKRAAFPPSSKWLSRQIGVEPPAPGVAHTALGDARWARDVYDAITGGKAVPARTEKAGA